MTHYVYQLVDNSGAPFYVGQSSSVGNSRERLHRSRGNKGVSVVGKHIQSLDGGFHMERLHEGLSCDEALEIEASLIRKMPKLVNSRRGGAGGKPGWNHSAEARAKIARANRGTKKSAETRAKISEANRGRKWSDEEKQVRLIQVVCPHCGKSGGNMGMNRWHFDHCSARGR